LAALLTALIMIGAAAVVAPPATGATDPPTPAADTSAYNPWLVIEPSSIAQWDLARTGLTVTGYGFAPGSAVRLLIDGDDGGEPEVADIGGQVTFGVAGQAPAGEYAVTLEAEEGTASGTLTIVTDEDAWADWDDEPYIAT